jgi:hypothetical protein
MEVFAIDRHALIGDVDAAGGTRMQIPRLEIAPAKQPAIALEHNARSCVSSAVSGMVSGMVSDIG